MAYTIWRVSINSRCLRFPRELHFSCTGHLRVPTGSIDVHDTIPDDCAVTDLDTLLLFLRCYIGIFYHFIQTIKFHGLFFFFFFCFIPYIWRVTCYFYRLFRMRKKAIVFRIISGRYPFCYCYPSLPTKKKKTV